MTELRQMTKKRTRITAGNSTYKKLAVQWINEVQFFNQTFVQVESFLLRNRQLLIAANRWRNFKKKPHMIEWSIFLNSENLNIYQRFEGEIRFGPEYLQLKTEPTIQEFYGKIFGDWFYKTSDGIFLQEWNSLQNANSNLIYIDFKELKFITLQKNIESVFWNMSEDNKYYNLNINTSFIEIRINKDMINKNYTTNDL